MSARAAASGRAPAAGAPVPDRFDLEETGFDEVPPPLRRHYRHWRGPTDTLGPNEILCPVCHVVLRATRALRAGDELHCVPCLSHLQVVARDGVLVAVVKAP